MVLQAVLSSNEITITENWDILKIVTTKEKAENINVSDTIEYVPSWSEYKLSDLDRQMYNRGFRYKRILVMKNNENVELINELMPVTLDTATPISEGKMRDDCGDLRFYWWNEDSQAWEEISYWIDNDTVNSSSTKAILRIPKVSANGYVNIVVYYGARHYGRKDDLTIGFGNRSNSGKVLSFDGEDDYVQLPVDESLKPPVTVAIMFKPISDPYNIQILRTGSAHWNGLYALRTKDYTIRADLNNENGERTTINGTTEIEANKTYFVAFSWDYQTAKIYVNGVKEREKTAGAFNGGTGFNPKFGSVGADINGFEGEIYAMYIWKRILDESEIQAIYENPNDPPRAGLVLWLAPDSVDDVNGKWLDKSGLDNDGTINGATPVEVRTFEESVQTSKVMSFDGVDDYVANDTVDFGFLKDKFTIFMMFKINQHTQGDGLLTIGSGVLRGVTIWLRDHTNCQFGAAFRVADDKRYFACFGNVEYNKAYRLVFVKDGSESGYLRVEDDIKQVGLISDTATTDYTGIRIGRAWETFNGDIYCVMIWNRVLSDEEVQQLHNDPNNPPLDGLVLWLDGTSIDEANGKWLNKAPVLKSGYVEPLDGTINGATPTDLLSSAWSEEIDMNNGLRIVWRGKVVKKVENGNSVVLYVRTNNLGKLIGEVV